MCNYVSELQLLSLSVFLEQLIAARMLVTAASEKRWFEQPSKVSAVFQRRFCTKCT